MFLLGVYVMRQIGILNMKEFPQAYNWLVTLSYGTLSIAIPVEIEQYLAARILDSRLAAKTKEANNPMDRSGVSAAS